jgi:hypothetical protein
VSQSTQLPSLRGRAPGGALAQASYANRFNTVKHVLFRVIRQFPPTNKSLALDGYHAENRPPAMRLLETPASIGRELDGAWLKFNPLCAE